MRPIDPRKIRLPDPAKDPLPEAMRVIILAGAPGSGKSTWAKSIVTGRSGRSAVPPGECLSTTAAKAGRGFILFSADSHFIEGHDWYSKHSPRGRILECTHCGAIRDEHTSRGACYQFSPSQLPEAHQGCLKRYVEFVGAPFPKLASIHTVIVDNSNTTPAEIAPYYAVAEAYGHDVSIRVFTAERDNVHGAPWGTVTRLRENMRTLEKLAPPWWRFTYHDAQGMCNRCLSGPCRCEGL